jgi:hypothetical protein
MEVRMKRNSKSAIVRIYLLVTCSLLGVGIVVGAQEQTYPANEPQSQTQPAPPQELSADQLDNLVAPIALYPDPLLSQVLVASTYPLEVVEASQWLQRNKNLRGQDLVNAAKEQSWDPSIQALVVVPDTLRKLNEDIRWTTDLGEAFLAQEADVMNAVQRMRGRAQDNGRLASTRQQKVSTQQQGGQRIIVIEPAYPEVIYVPVYDPVYVWGPPVYGYYPPLYYPRYGFGFGIGFNLGFCYANWGGWGFWGWGPNWYGGTVYVNNYFFHHYGYHQHWGGGYRDRYAWVHNPVHRLNVPYRTAPVAARYGGHSTISRDSYRTAAGRNSDQGFRNASLPVQRNQYSPRQQYQSSPRYQAASDQNRVTTQARRYQNQGQPGSQASQAYRSSQRAQEGARVVSFGSQRQQQYRSPQQYRSTQQTYRTTQVQQFRSMSQPRVQTSQQFRSAPQMSASRFGGGSVNRSSGGGISRSGGGGGFSRGGGNRGR